MLSDIETAQRNNRLYSALKEGNTALTQLQKQVTLEDVEKLNDEAAEAAEYQERLRELLGETLTAEQDAAALEELEKIQASSLCPSMANPQVLPCTLAQILEASSPPRIKLCCPHPYASDVLHRRSYRDNAVASKNHPSSLPVGLPLAWRSRDLP